MGRRERDTGPAVETFVTGMYSPFAEGGTAFFSPRLPPLFLFARILVFWIGWTDNMSRKEIAAKELRIDENL